ncbi:MAG: hypothetical protein QOI34_834 [Verrucomicrobiota bacterium]|jgi:polyisoprenoid-binding protein YceI
MLLVRYLFILTAALMALKPARANDTYQFDSTHSKIAFDVHHFIGSTVGKFRRFSGTIDLDREQPERSSIFVRIEVDSIDTGIQKRDDHLRGAEFFDAPKFPEITYRSRSVKRTGPRTGDVLGDLTMHGVTKPMVLHVKLLGELADERSRWEATATPIKRRDFGLMFSTTAEALSGIGQDVGVKIEIDAFRPK